MTTHENKQDSQSFKSRWGLSFLIAFLALFWITLVGLEWANADSGDSDDFNFNWLDPEKKIYVLQNRKYVKSGHPLLSVIGGVGFSNPYRNTYNLDGKFSFFMSESWGIEVFYGMTSNSANSTFDALGIASPSALPLVREVRSQYGGQVLYVPWYAKINVFNSILYFDWYFGVGAGTVQTFVNTTRVVGAAPNYVQNDLLGIFLSTGHMFYLSQSWLFRLDFTSALYQAGINGVTGATAWYSNINVGAGIGFRF